jgi:lipopolysaccharide biosynthesis protein
VADPRKLRFLAFYLPQFHPTVENDMWWGPGFTEWTNVAKANPLFRGHEQPDLPADLGFYDLRLPETRIAQAVLAAAHGVSGFCYFHYWFEGRRLLGRPFAEVLRSGEPDFPFCLCWANENWSRAWDGKSGEILVEQTYSAADDQRHIRWLCEAFADHRYVTVDGKPVFLVYRALRLPDARRTTDTWRAEAQRAGFEDLYLCAVHGGRDQRRDPAALGMDAAVQFAPFYGLKRRRHGRLARAAHRWFLRRSADAEPAIYEYSTVVDDNLSVPVPLYTSYPCVSPGFDSSPRRPLGGATITVGSTPDLYEHWLRRVVERFEPPTPEENFVFVNAWNEWAEGNHLEPGRRWGRRYLEAHARVAT